MDVLSFVHIFFVRHLTHVMYTDETICLGISPLLVGVIMLTLNILLLLLYYLMYMTQCNYVQNIWYSIGTKDTVTSCTGLLFGY